MDNPFARADMDLLTAGYQANRETGLYQKDGGPWLSAIEARRGAGLLPPEPEPEPAGRVTIDAIDLTRPGVRGSVRLASGITLQFDAPLVEAEYDLLYRMISLFGDRIRREMAGQEG